MSYKLVVGGQSAELHAANGTTVARLWNLDHAHYPPGSSGYANDTSVGAILGLPASGSLQAVLHGDEWQAFAQKWAAGYESGLMVDDWLVGPLMPGEALASPSGQVRVFTGRQDVTGTPEQVLAALKEGPSGAAVGVGVGVLVAALALGLLLLLRGK